MRGLSKYKIAVIGLGYVGLPLAVEFGKKYSTVGFDINAARIKALKAGRDVTLETTSAELKASHKLRFSAQTKDLKSRNIFIVTVPTPIDQYKRPDLTPLLNASETVGRVLKKGDIVIYESTVYPGCTEEICVPALERYSSLRFNKDFYCGYSPERINPGDKQHRLATIKKVTSGSMPRIADLVNALYASIITAGTHQASSIKVAEAAKVIENSRGHEMELPAFPPGTGGRPLHRCGSLLFDAQGHGNRLPPGNDPGGAAHQRRHGGVRCSRDRQAHDRTAHHGRRRQDPHSRACF